MYCRCFDRLKLGEILDVVIKDFKEHCIVSTEKEHAKFRQWICQWFLPCHHDLDKIEESSEKIRSHVKMQTESLSKLATEVAEFQSNYSDQSAASMPGGDATATTSKSGMLTKLFRSLSGAGSPKASLDESAAASRKSTAPSRADKTVPLELATRLAASNKIIQYEANVDSAYETEIEQVNSGLKDSDKLLIDMRSQLSQANE